MPPRRSLAVALGALALAVLGGCGSSRTPAPDLSRVELPPGSKTVSYLHGAVQFDAPEGWAIETGSAPLVVTLGSGPALIAVWRYPRSARQPLPDSIPTLNQAKDAVVSAARARDPTLRLISAATIAQGNVLGVELDAVETVRGQARRVRSAHLYFAGAEFVVDEFAPPALFHSVDRTVFSPLLRSVRLSS